MLLVAAWLLFVANTLVFLQQAEYVTFFSFLEHYAFALLGTAVVVWFLLLIEYAKSLSWINKMANGLDVDKDLASFKKLKTKWSRTRLQLFFITFLLLAFWGLDVLTYLGVRQVVKPSWITLGVWIVWLHCLVWFTLAWNRDRRLRAHLEREIVFETQEAQA